MSTDYLQELLQSQVAAGTDPAYWWGDRVPVASIDKSVTDLLDLTGKKAIVTGGAGRNLGQACVNRLAALGADVAAIDLPATEAVRKRLRWAEPPDVKAVAARASEKWDARVVGIEGDVVTKTGIEAAIAESVEQLGGVDILVNNAIEVRVGDFLGMSYEDIELSARGTFVAPVYCTRVALEHMIPQGRGVIVNVCSEASQTATPSLTVYGALKLGMNGFTNFAGKELARHGIRVVGVNPGCMWGPDRDLLDDTPEGLYPLVRTAIQRFQLPEEVANMIAFLSTDAASCMAGTMVNMGGGMSL
ncbi:MAG: SDR family oxidoreductase [Pseudonocardia sp.]|uniref:SDR family NAD(P)-dependent oxidoreductase n=1 Tax=unclassified Pseudonocardia TaxID=2619320 RepID=UPI00086EF142|nr:MULTISPECIES: SDR family oxidoreductase [unclassified Pseudonocardia]MBN9112421.1 SDR family oxidoreductase [Pseudonocardia sp.]ODU27307.1 MAG: 3-oxoacyl-ACP reductase [Pseudonocardia sp. SCN 72-51]ODV08920.1 MAG: 3-oxoacyl-ACP reductase [Pseudonocardia sp. SCN 73-27]